MRILDLKGVPMPVIGFGTWRLNGAGCVSAVRGALDDGYRHLDTAAFYDNEAEVGRAIRESGLARESLFVTTKVWFDKLAPEALKGSAEGSLRKLGLEFVDLLLIHWPSRKVPMGDSLRAMRELQESGKARRIGVSNFPVGHMREAVEVHGAPVVCNQVEYHPYLGQDKVIGYARAHDIAITAYLPLAEGRCAKDPVLAAIGARHGKSGAQVTLRWLIEQDGVAAIPMSTSPAHRRANLEVFDFVLDAADRAAIAALPKDRRILDAAFAPKWD